MRCHAADPGAALTWQRRLELVAGWYLVSGFSDYTQYKVNRECLLYIFVITAQRDAAAPEQPAAV